MLLGLCMVLICALHFQWLSYLDQNSKGAPHLRVASPDIHYDLRHLMCNLHIYRLVESPNHRLFR